MKRYGIGMDFGTLSARAVLVRLSDGEPLPYSCVCEYPSGVMTSLGGVALPWGYALQDPADYLTALETCLGGVIRQNGIDPEEVASIGIDFTTSTILPVDEEGTPLCRHPRFAQNPHAYVKLWKHHGGEKYVAEAEEAARRTGDDLLSYSGGRMSCELMLPKLIETAREAPEVYDAAALFMNTGDYVARVLTGNPCHSSAYASLKEYRKPNGAYPSKEYYAAVEPKLADLIGTKVPEEVNRVCDRIGTLCAEWSERTGLPRDVVVAAPIADAHAAFPVAGIEDGLLLLALGTSACACLISDKSIPVQGVLSQGVDIAAPDRTTYDAGISAMGDLFAGFVDNCVPSSYERAAQAEGMNLHAYLTSLAEKQAVGEHGLLALDWWNGSRSVLSDNRLSGIMVGMTLATRPEDIYRALMETCAFSLRRIVQMYEEHGIEIRRVVATGGISRKNPLMMQILANVLGKEIGVLTSEESTAIGSATYGAVACGYYATLEEASEHMRCPLAATYLPNKADAGAYDALYCEYLRLYDYFGRGENPIMKKLYRDPRG